ncbi:MAG: rhodanese-like domain-containing protein [Desulfobacteraceae bacterium]|jgi:hypothetical protein|nr:rhodanese-like domain-containing protein [Desulfobacteraceae bacterium]
MNSRLSIFISAAAVLFTIIFIYYGQRPVAPTIATWEDVIAEAEAGGYRIITTEALAESYEKASSDLLLIDTRQEWEYRTGHIEGALNFPMKPTWWARWQKSDDLEDFLGSNKDRTLVFY